MGLIAVDGGAFFWSAEPYCSPLYCKPIQIWKTDGTEAGTVHVASAGNTCPSTSNTPYLSHEADGGDGAFYFTFYDPVAGEELWISDGTGSGTHMVTDIFPGAEPQFECPFPHSSAPHELTRVGNLLYFAAFEPDHGTELWRTDGTAAGTVLVQDINPGAGSSSPEGLTNVNGILIFSADDGVRGRELWGSNGSDTRPLTDIALGTPSSAPQAITVVGSRIFFTADDGAHGRELWAIPISPVPSTPTSTPTPFPTSTPTASPCTGDCDGDHAVTVDEVLTMVDMSLADTARCTAGDANRDGEITVDEIVRGVNNVLKGCSP